MNKDPDTVPEEAHLIILNSKSAMYMNNNGKHTKHTIRISSRRHFLWNCEKYKIHDIDWCEGGLHFGDIATKNVGEPYLPPRMKYIMVILDNL